jgi:hypothetical protein
MEEKPPWVTCYLTDMLLSYVRDELRREKQIYYGALFRGIEGFETPSDPKLFLSDVSNWVPLSVLRELELQCEKISGQKDIAYDAAKDYFSPGQKATTLSVRDYRSSFERCPLGSHICQSLGFLADQLLKAAVV